MQDKKGWAQKLNFLITLPCDTDYNS